MSNINKKYTSPEYWTQLIQIMLFDRIQHYLDDRGMTKKEFAEKLGVSKGYVSQILNGDYDHKLSKLTELALACELVPKIELVPIKYAQQVVEGSYFKPIEWNEYYSFFSEVDYSRKYKSSPLQFIVNQSELVNLKSNKPIVNKINNLHESWGNPDHVSKNIA